MLYFSSPEFLLPTAIPAILSEGQATFLSYDLKKVFFFFFFLFLFQILVRH